MKVAVVLSLLVLAVAPSVSRSAVIDTLSLRSAVAIGLRQNPSVRTALAESRVANARAWTATSDLLPEITAEAEYERNLEVSEAFLPETLFNPTGDPSTLVPVRFGADNTWRAQLSLELPIVDLGGWLRASAGHAGRSLATIHLEATIQKARTEIQLAFLDLLLTQERAAILGRRTRQVETTLADARSRLDAGLAAPYEPLQLETASNVARGDYRRSLLDISSAERTLAMAMGRDPALPLAVEGTLRPAQSDGTGLASALRALAPGSSAPPAAGMADLAARVDRRPSVMEAARRVDIQRKLHRAALAGLLPRAVAFGTVGVTAQQNGSPDFFGENPRQRSTTLLAGMRIELPVFEFERFSRVEEAAAELQSSEIALQTRRYEARREIGDLESQLWDAASRAQEGLASTRTARRGHAIAIAASLAGGGSRIQVMEADVRLGAAEFDYAEAVHRFLTTAIRLEAAGGGPFDVEGLLHEWSREP